MSSEARAPRLPFLPPDPDGWGAATPRGSLLAWRLAAATLAIAIFLFDSLSTFEGAVAVLYVVVVLLAARSSRRLDIGIAAAAGITLTLVAYIDSHGFNHVGSQTVRAFVSLAAIGITALLALQNQTATKRLAAQARLLNLSHDMIFVRDGQGAITFWNRTAQDVYGWPAEEALGRVADDLLHTRYPEPRAAIEARLLDTGSWDGILEQRTRAGKTLILASRWVVQRDHAGRPVGVMETHTDITERRQAQHALLEAQAELAHATRVATLGELTASIAHEVNQPLMAVVTSGEAGMRWLRRDPPDLHEVGITIERIVSEGRRASEIVKRIRSFLSKAPAQRDTLHVGTIIEEAARLVEHELNRERVALHIDVAPDLPAVSADRIQLQQVLVNLMVNAAQAMAGQAAPRRLAIQAAQSNADFVTITVSDTGPGIDLTAIDRLFNPFYTTKPQGMGMGLAICRSTVLAHGGELTATNTPGAGASFALTLPPTPSPTPT